MALAARDIQRQQFRDEGGLLLALDPQRRLLSQQHTTFTTGLGCNHFRFVSHPLPGKHRVDESQPINAVVEDQGYIAHYGKVPLPLTGRKRQQQKSVSYGAGKRCFPGHARGIHMDELVISGAIREGIDTRLVDGDPFRRFKLPADQGGQRGD